MDLLATIGWIPSMARTVVSSMYSLWILRSLRYASLDVRSHALAGTNCPQSFVLAHACDISDFR
eukprot:13400629-Ditylum_brightwellii.AAC.1